METYTGGIFSQSIDGGRAGAQLHFSGSTLVAETRDGLQLTIDLLECELKVGGASGQMWFCRAANGDPTCYCEAPGFEFALRNVPGLTDRVSTLLAGRLAQRRRGMSLALLGVCALFLCLAGGFFALRSAGRSAAKSLPTSVDTKIGHMAIGTMDLGGPLVTKRNVQTEITALVERLGEQAQPRFDYHVQVVQAPTVNAFALPGGEIVVYTGLIEHVETGEQLAAVLAHEISHVTARHGLERITQSVGLATAVQLLLGDVTGLAALAVDLLQSGALTSYGRDQEREADEQGLRLMHQAGMNPHAMAEVFQILKKQQPELPEELEWLSTHPDMDERIAQTARAAKALGPLQSRPLPFDFQTLRAELGFTTPKAQPAANQKENADEN